jgi:signal transduction histidine kinase
VTGKGDETHTAQTPVRRRSGPGLSGKLLMFTILFVMVAEVLIFVPSIANFRNTWLADRIGAAQIAALVLEAAPDDMVPVELESDLLAQVGAFTVAHKRGDTRRLLAISDMPPAVDRHDDLRETRVFSAIVAAFDTLLYGDGRVIRVIGDAPLDGEFIEIVIDETPLRRAMLTYSVNILTLSIIISVITAALVYFALNWLLVRPMRRLTETMVRFSEDPEDASRIVEPSGRSDEIGVAERQLAAMQRQLAGMLAQKNRLATLGLAVSKINHDLRNMLTSAQLLVDRVSTVRDPLVQRLAPKLVRTLDRAAAFCANTLKYGSAHESPPQRRLLDLAALVDDVGDTIGLSGHASIRFVNAVDREIRIDADPDQLFRILMNLVRNALEVLEGQGKGDSAHDMIRISARREGAVVTIEVADTGPGLPEAARAHLFEAFHGSTRAGGTGLGLAIAAELVRAHGGTIRLAEGTLGATFSIEIPDRVVELGSGSRRQRRTG